MRMLYKVFLPYEESYCCDWQGVCLQHAETLLPKRKLLVDYQIQRNRKRWIYGGAKKKRGQPWDGCSLPSWKPFSFFDFRQLHNRTFPWPVFMPILKYDFHYMLELNNIHKHKCLHSFTSGLNFKLPKWKSVSLFNLVRFFKMILAGFAEDWFYRLCLHSRTGRVSQIKEGVEEKLFLWQT